MTLGNTDLSTPTPKKNHNTILKKGDPRAFGAELRNLRDLEVNGKTFWEQAFVFFGRMKC